VNRQVEPAQWPAWLSTSIAFLFVFVVIFLLGVVSSELAAYRAGLTRQTGFAPSSPHIHRVMPNVPE
jgi:tryptophan-rich sensory protein